MSHDAQRPQVPYLLCLVNSCPLPTYRSQKKAPQAMLLYLLPDCLNSESIFTNSYQIAFKKEDISFKSFVVPRMEDAENLMGLQS
jgi:hypothetical protein